MVTDLFDQSVVLAKKQNMAFTLPMENQLMDAVLNQHQKPRAAAKAWLKAHPTMLEAWVAGVGSRDGPDRLTVASARLAAQKQFTNPS